MAEVNRGQIRVKALVALIDRPGHRQVVTRYESPDGAFHRLVGGSVEFGESAIEAAVREVREEVGVRLDPATVAFCGVMESRFIFEGVPAHEIVFVYAADVSTDTVPDRGGWFEDDNVPMWLEWRSLAGDELPLYPEGVDARLAQIYP